MCSTIRELQGLAIQAAEAPVLPEWPNTGPAHLESV